MNDKYNILVVEDEDSDFFLLERAFKKNEINSPIYRVTDGLEALHYMQGEGLYSNRKNFPTPDVLIVDLKTPRMSGMEFLAWVRENAQHRVIPTIVMSSSQQQADIVRAYELGANTYFVKPTDFQTLVNMIRTIHEYWLQGAKPMSQRRKP